jgi:hypothetical protein
LKKGIEAKWELKKVINFSGGRRENKLNYSFRNEKFGRKTICYLCSRQSTLFLEKGKDCG